MMKVIFQSHQCLHVRTSLTPHIHADATVVLNSSVLTVLEDGSDAELCILLTNIPSGGISSMCEIEVFLNFTSVSTCKSLQQHCSSCCNCIADSSSSILYVQLMMILTMK